MFVAFVFPGAGRVAASEVDAQLGVSALKISENQRS